MATHIVEFPSAHIQASRLTVTSVSGDGSALSGIQSSNVSDFASNVTRITNLESGDLTIDGEKTFSSNLEVGTANLFVDTTTSNVGIGTTNPRSTLDINATDALIVPNGATAERPSTAVVGMIRYNSTTDYFETYTTGGWSSIATPPSIVSLSPNPATYADVTTEVITITGSFFDSSTSVQLEGVDGTLYNTTDFVFTDTSSIGFKIGTPASGQAANRPYKLAVTNGAGLTTKSTQTLGFGNPTWSSPASGSTQTFFTLSSTTLTLSATDALGGSAVSYSVVGSLPGGLTLSGNTISGTSTESGGTTNTVTIRATDTVDASAYTDLTFTIETINALYAFSSHTFTNAGVTGRTGPTLTQLRTAYTPSWTDNTNYFNVTTQGIQEWTVPKTGTYEIDAYGASGGAAYIAGTTTISYGGRGARMRARFSLSKSDTVYITVGQKGEDLYTQTRGGGGGGGTFVILNTNLLIAAGGGGGSGKYARPASADANHNSSSGNAGEARGNSYNGTGGTGGNGGNGGYYSAGGAGFFGNGGISTHTNPRVYGGLRPLQGSEGGEGGYYNSSNFGVDGGFGGGGGNYAGGGGGAGYSGGGSGGWNSQGGAGGGGGSYINTIGTNTLTELSTENSHGKVVITFIG